MPSWEVNFDLHVDTTRPSIITDLAQIHALAAVIRAIPIPPAVQQRLDRLNIVRAVRGTTGIEGTEMSEEEVAQVMASGDAGPILGPDRERDEQETRNASTLMQHVAQYVRQHPDAPLNEPLILSFHRMLTGGINYPHNEPGSYRNHAVNVGPYRPPPDGEQVRELMARFVRWFNEGPPTGWDSVVRAIVAHCYVVSIHPFGDGNGRTARAVESFLLYRAGVNARGYYSLANYYYYQHRDQYIHSMNDVQLRGSKDLTGFVAFALRGLVSELQAVYDEVLEEVSILAYRDHARRILADTGRLGPVDKMSTDACLTVLFCTEKSATT